jgi:hypothetical protein
VNLRSYSSVEAIMTPTNSKAAMLISALNVFMKERFA